MSADNIARFTRDELLEAEDQADVLTFLARARPLEGCSYDDDERLEHGRSVILRWLAACSLELAGPTPKGDVMQMPQTELVYECAEALYFLRNLDPLQPKGTDDAEDCDHADSGRHRILGWIEARLLRAAGYDDESRPHKSACERLEEANATARAIEERQTQGALQ